ncbi:hypothetical protein EXS54_02870 [Patescibacteria group bacterium]|nr:hypothetical protein [Patescibacteria group bacterium]
MYNSSLNDLIKKFEAAGSDLSPQSMARMVDLGDRLTAEEANKGKRKAQGTEEPTDEPWEMINVQGGDESGQGASPTKVLGLMTPEDRASADKACRSLYDESLKDFVHRFEAAGSVPSAQLMARFVVLGEGLADDEARGTHD